MEQYERVRLLGQGSYGTAILVREVRGSGRRGALRVVKEINLAQLPPERQEEAQAEARVLRALCHVNVVAYLDAFIEEKKLHIVMEFADDGDLAAVLRRRKEESRRFAEDEALVIFVQCCLALQHIHSRHVLHRDLKAQNVFLTRAGIVKLGDFGIAKILDHTAGQAVTLIGTPNYLSPEVCNNEAYGVKADVWALGVILYEMLALEAPFRGANLAALAVRIATSDPAPLDSDLYGEEMRGVVDKCMQKKAEDRPSANELVNMSISRRGLSMLPSAAAEVVANHPALQALVGLRDACSLQQPLAPPSSSVSRPRSSCGVAEALRDPTPNLVPQQRLPKSSSSVNRGSSKRCTSGDAVDKFLFNQEVFSVAKQLVQPAGQAPMSARGSSRRDSSPSTPRCVFRGRPSTHQSSGREARPSTPQNNGREAPLSARKGPRPTGSRSGFVKDEFCRGRDVAAVAKARNQSNLRGIALPMAGSMRDGLANVNFAPGSERTACSPQAGEEQHLRALAEAAAQARRDRRTVKSKMCSRRGSLWDQDNSPAHSKRSSVQGQASPSSCGPNSSDGETNSSTPASVVQELSTLQVLASELSTRSPSSPSTSPTRTPHGGADSGSSTAGSVRGDARPCRRKSSSETIDADPTTPAESGVAQADVERANSPCAIGRGRHFCAGLIVSPSRASEKPQDPPGMVAESNLDITLLLPPSQPGEGMMCCTPDEDMWEEIAARLRTPSPPSRHNRHLGKPGSSARGLSSAGPNQPNLTETASPDLWLQLTQTPSPKNVQQPLSTAEDMERPATTDLGRDCSVSDVQNQTNRQMTEDITQADPFFLTPTLEYSLTGPIS